jgi:peptidoglycan/LPS O-acetylase OafA/YrhL
MALSEDEQRKLEEIERALHRADPGFAGTLNFAARQRHRRVVAAVIFAIGLLVLVAGAVLAQGPPLVGVAVSVLGFVTMVAAAGPLLPGRRARAGGATADRRTGWSGMEDRFRHRFEHPDE